MPLSDETKKKLIFSGAIAKGDDGFYHFWNLDKQQGYLSSSDLRDIAELLDQMNKAWNEEIYSLCQNIAKECL